ncbi:MAG TPA: hypothetical protein VGW34_03545 [Allosphingosinicella sp.]|nr:hypothetical protein [Allosphingosinicella sp.]
MPAAQAAAKGADARYFVGQFQLQIGRDTNNMQMQAQGIEAMVASGGGDPADRALLLRNHGAFAQKAGDNAKALRAFQEYLKLNPSDQEIATVVAAMQAQQNPDQALATFEQQIAAAKAAGQKPPENTYGLALKLAVDRNMQAKAVQLSRELAAAYPSPANWRNALVLYRQNAQLDEASELDLLRLMRAAKALTSEADYYRLANTLNTRGLPGETKAVIDEGMAANAFKSNKATFTALAKVAGGRISEDRAALGGQERKAMAASDGKLALTTGDVYYGYGDYAKAAALYRAALQKGSVDSNVVNTRLGMALALAGQKAEAQAAFKAVTGVRAGLAGLWLLWLNQRG